MWNLFINIYSIHIFMYINLLFHAICNITFIERKQKKRHIKITFVTNLSIIKKKIDNRVKVHFFPN